MMDDASVRAPLPVMRDRLYGVDMVMLNRPRGNYRERSQVDAFRDFRLAVQCHPFNCRQPCAQPCYLSDFLRRDCRKTCIWHEV